MNGRQPRKTAPLSYLHHRCPTLTLVNSPDGPEMRQTWASRNLHPTMPGDTGATRNGLEDVSLMQRMRAGPQSGWKRPDGSAACRKRLLCAGNLQDAEHG